MQSRPKALLYNTRSEKFLRVETGLMGFKLRLSKDPPRVEEDAFILSADGVFHSVSYPDMALTVRKGALTLDHDTRRTCFQILPISGSDQFHFEIRTVGTKCLKGSKTLFHAEEIEDSELKHEHREHYIWQLRDAANPTIALPVHFGNRIG
jgi:hypothetical protein